MKKLTCVLLMGCSFAFAYDIGAMRNSWGAFVGAINGVLVDNSGVIQYLPGYGLHIGSREVLTSNPQGKAITDLSIIVSSLATSIRGLDEGDWVSVAYKSEEPEYEVLVRMKPNRPASLQVWLNGVKE